MILANKVITITANAILNTTLIFLYFFVKILVCKLKILTILFDGNMFIPYILLKKC